MHSLYMIGMYGWALEKREMLRGYISFKCNSEMYSSFFAATPYRPRNDKSVRSPSGWIINYTLKRYVAFIRPNISDIILVKGY